MRLSPTAKMALVPVLLTLGMAAGNNAIMTATWEIENVASMVTVGIEAYWDITAINPVLTISWGTLEPGQSKSVEVFVKNSGTAPIMGVLNTSDWDPLEAGDFISLSWDYGENVLLPGRIRRTGITIQVMSNITGVENFAFKIILTGVQS